MNEQEKNTAEETTAALMSDEQPLPENTGSENNSAQTPVNDFTKDPAVMSYIEQQVQEGIKKALQGTPPKANTADPTEQEKKQFDKMTYRERLNLFKTNPQVYSKLAKGVK
ncbi:MAG: hypothetical protein LBR74_05060 [Eubacterium sp.]|jgi:hypothetical protein|nr:hypothetical protein [Eubacterium sp.]